MPRLRRIWCRADFCPVESTGHSFGRSSFVAIFPIMSESLTIKTNGESRQIESGSSLLHLLQTLDLDPQTLVVELNRTIVPRAIFADTPLNDGDEVELVHFVGGG